MEKQESSSMILHIYRFLEALEDTMNVPLCGLFLVMLSAMCFVAFSAVTVKKLFAYFRVEAAMCIIYFWLQCLGKCRLKYFKTVLLLFEANGRF
jgi:hypothetical protein